MKTIKKLIIMISIAIVCLILFLVLFKTTKKEIEEHKGDAGQQIEYTLEEKQVTNNNSFYTVSKCVSQYLDTVNKKNTRYYGKDEEGNEILIIEEKEIKEKIHQLLSEQFIQKNSIQIDNVYDYVEELEQKVVFIPLKMKSIIKPEAESYVVYGVEQTLQNEFIKEAYFIVNLDIANNTYSIEPLEDNNNFEEIKIPYEPMQIEKNIENTYVSEMATYEYIIREYINNYKRLALGSPQIAYDLLDEKYKEERFGNIENYQEYIQKNKNEIFSLQPNQYLVNQHEGYVEYVCKDKYENLYIFHEKAPMDITIQLDTYTIPSEKFTSTYEKQKPNKKVLMNIDRWVQMLNTRNYKTAYEVLDETYRNNTYGSEENFENMMREKLPLHYEVEYMDFSQEGDLYSQKIVLTDILGEDSTKIEITIIMQLKEEFDFIMSFSFLEE